MTKLIRIEAPPNERHYKNPRGSLPEGAWSQEPDKVVWIDEVTKLDCMLLRNDLGTWCGYVGVPETHPYFGLDCKRVEFAFEREIDFSSTCKVGASEDEKVVCHCRTYEHGETWWFGFNLASCWDYIPILTHQVATTQDYRDINYARTLVESLSLALLAVQVPSNK